MLAEVDAGRALAHHHGHFVPLVPTLREGLQSHHRTVGYVEPGAVGPGGLQERALQLGVGEGGERQGHVVGLAEERGAVGPRDRCVGQLDHQVGLVLCELPEILQYQFRGQVGHLLRAAVMHEGHPEPQLGSRTDLLVHVGADQAVPDDADAGPRLAHT